MKKQISEISVLTEDLYYDYVQPAAIAAGIAEEGTAHDETWGDYTTCLVNADVAEHIGHCMYCACMNAHIYRNQYRSEVEAREMLYTLDVSIRYRPETADQLTALRNAIAAMLPAQPKESAQAAQEAHAAEAEQQPTETEEAPQEPAQAAQEPAQEPSADQGPDAATLSAIASIIAEADRMSGAYFFQPPQTAGARRSYERYHSHDTVTWTESGHTYTAAFIVSCTCTNVYASGNYTRDGQKTTLTAIRNSYKRISA